MAPLQPSQLFSPAQRGKTVTDAINLLNSEWDLELSPDGSPQRGQSNSVSSTLESKCFSKIRFLAWKSHAGIEPACNEFYQQANELYIKWVKKPKAERGVLPESSSRKRPVSSRERAELVKRLHEILTYECRKIGHEGTPQSIAQRAREGSPSAINRIAEHQATLDTTPIKSSLPKPQSDSKRQREEHFPDISTVTTHKKPRSLSAEKSANTASRNAHNISFETVSTIASSVFSNAPADLPNTQDTAPDDIPGVHNQAAAQNFDGDNFRVPQADKTESSNYGSSSFDFNSIIPDLMGKGNGSRQSPDINPTDQIAGDDELSQNLLGVGLADNRRGPGQDVSDTDDEDRHHSAPVIPHAELELGVESLKDKLAKTFGTILHDAGAKHTTPSKSRTPTQSTTWKNLPFAVQYEILRVCLHTQASVNELKLSDLPTSFDDYNTFWGSLKRQPAFDAKVLPEPCSHEVWKATLNGFQSGHHVVAFGGTLSFEMDANSDRLFDFKLRTMVLDKGHRLGRRMGHDRILDIDMPNFEGRKTPQTLRTLGPRGREVLIDWLVNQPHKFLERLWRPFCVKPAERKGKRSTMSQSDDRPHRVSFFAVDGHGFQKIEMSPLPGIQTPHFVVTLEQVFNLLRPTRKNTHQPYLKLFQRTTLAISKNIETVLLEKNQIRFKDDIRCHGEVMTDGAGRISWNLAMKITTELGLDYFPSSFQGRLGEAKGLWTVDPSDRSQEDWIEVYGSQQKWTRSSKPDGESEDRSHRVLEVNDWSAPLKSADLNLQLLPLLMERAINKEFMKHQISHLLKVGLDQEVEKLREAYRNPESLRAWVREFRTSVGERLRNRSVLYKGGIPHSIEERLNMLLDSGFDPYNLWFVKDLVRQLLKQKCDDLKERMNITVGRSAYVYMVPDFWGVLEEGEIFMDISNFKDAVSGASGIIQQGQDVLVARSPAHFVSDIQKVRAVAKSELMGLRDVIVFSTKASPGRTSLATMLSGGDFDGDRAWVCWEPTIVDNFESADVPKGIPNLVDLGFIHKDKTTYRELVNNLSQPEATNLFLKKSFDFNMRQNMLGICTNWKDRMCYVNGYSCEASVWVSQLLSDLVDQPKQGFTFTDSDWRRMQAVLRAKFQMKPPIERLPWKNGVTLPNSSNIIDHAAAVADEAIESCLTDYHNSVVKPPVWDEDVAKMYRWADEEAKNNEEWKTLTDHLDAKLKEVVNTWAICWKNRKSEEDKPEFEPILFKCYDMYTSIVPNTDTPLSRLLLPKNLDPDNTQWAALKASTLFALYKGKRDVPKMAWLLAGKHFAWLKATYSGKGFPHAVIPAMYAMQKPDAAYVRRLKADHVETEDLGGSVVGSAADLQALRD